MESEQQRRSLPADLDEIIEGAEKDSLLVAADLGRRKSVADKAVHLEVDERSVRLHDIVGKAEGVVPVAVVNSERGQQPPLHKARAMAARRAM